MKITRSIQQTGPGKGDWFLYTTGIEDGKEAKIEFCIRPIPAPEERRIESKHLGRERKSTMTGRGREVSINVDKAQAYHEERALHALCDARSNVYITIEDEKAAELYSLATGGKVVTGDKVVLDGKLDGIDGTARALKERFFADAPQIAIWISSKASELRVTAAKEEEGKDES